MTSVQEVSDRVKGYQKKVRECEVELASLKAKRDTVLSRLKSDFGVSTLEEAKRVRAKLEEDLKKSQVEITELEECLDSIMELDKK